MKHGLWALLLLGGLELGCVSRGGVAPGGALVHPQFPYSVTYEDEQSKSVLGDDWLLENYRRVDRKGAGSASAAKEVEIERKQGYEEVYELDFDDDDKADAKAPLPLPDLLLVNKKTNARIEVSTLLLDKRLADKELRILLSNIVENKAGTRSLFIRLGKVGAGLQKRTASRLLESGTASLEKQTGLVATVERADLDQLELDPKARWSRSRIFLLHAPFDYYALENPNAASAQHRYHKYRVLMLVEYTNSPEDFEAQYPDLLRLLNKIHLLSDDMLLDYLAEPLRHCTKGNGATLELTVSATGVPSVWGGTGLDRACTSGILEDFRFAATSELRRIERTYDFTKPLKPAWLTQGTYVEQRSARSESPPDAPAGTPPADDAPAEGPKPAKTVDGAATPPPAAPGTPGAPAAGVSGSTETNPAPSPAAPAP